MSGYQGYNQTEYTGANTDGGFYRTSDSAGSDGGAGGSSQSRSTQTRTHITPVTIKQILESEQHVPDGPYLIHNVELNLISFVGIVRNVVDNTSNVVVQVEDGTGKFEFRKWIDETLSRGDGEDETNGAAEEDADMKDSIDSSKELQLGKYVYVKGSLKDFNQKKNLQYPVIKPITDFNAVLYHYLEAVKVHAEAQGLGGGAKSGADGAALNANGNNNDNANSLFVSAPSHEELDTSDRVFNLIKENTPLMPDGVPVQFIQQTLKLSINDVMEQCSILEEKAKIYNGIDDETYLAVWLFFLGVFSFAIYTS